MFRFAYVCFIIVCIKAMLVSNNVFEREPCPDQLNKRPIRTLFMVYRLLYILIPDGLHCKMYSYNFDDDHFILSNISLQLLDESILVRSHSMFYISGSVLKLDTDLLVIVSNQRWHTLRLVNGQFMNESRLSAISGVNKLLKQVYKPKMIFSIDNENQLLIRAQLDPNNGRNLELSSCGLVPILQSTTKTIQLKWRFLGSVPINQNNKILMVILPVLYDKQLVRRIAIIDNQYVYTLPYVPMENYSKSHYQKYKVNKITIDDFLHCSWQLLDEYQSNQLAIILVLAYLLFLTILFVCICRRKHFSTSKPP